jgi:predicted peptidase
MPQCPKESFWAARVESILKFIEKLKAEFSADEDRVYLTGLSMGGFGTWFTAMAKPSEFAAIAPICGGGMAWNASVLNMPIWAFHGAKDTLVDPFHSDDMVRALKENGKDVTYTRVDNVGHNVWENAYNAELVDWLLSKKR